jgi:hypothetical protein
VSKVTLDIICDTAFGYRSDSLTNPHGDLVRAYEALLSLQSGANLAKFSAVVAVPGVPELINHAKFGPLVAPLFRMLPGLSNLETVVRSTQRIRTISRGILHERMAAGVAAADLDTKKDVMSLLVKARMGAKDGYQLSDDALVNQVVRASFLLHRAYA